MYPSQKYKEIKCHKATHIQSFPFSLKCMKNTLFFPVKIYEHDKKQIANIGSKRQTSSEI